MAALVIGGQPTPANPARVLNVSFQPSATDPTFVHYSVRITTIAAELGRVDLLSDAANPPVTVRARIAGGAAVAMTTEGVLSYIVPAGHFVLLQTVNEAGLPAFALNASTEIN
jgi:hypothetical protein